MDFKQENALASQKGAGLLELMVASAIGMLAAYFSLEFMDSSFILKSRIEIQQEVTQLKNRALATIDCQKTLKILDWKDIPMTCQDSVTLSLRNVSNQPIFPGDMAPGNLRIRVVGICQQNTFTLRISGGRNALVQEVISDLQFSDDFHQPCRRYFTAKSLTNCPHNTLPAAFNHNGPVCCQYKIIPAGTESPRCDPGFALIGFDVDVAQTIPNHQMGATARFGRLSLIRENNILGTWFLRGRSLNMDFSTGISSPHPLQITSMCCPIHQ